MHRIFVYGKLHTYIFHGLDIEMLGYFSYKYTPNNNTVATAPYSNYVRICCNELNRNIQMVQLILNLTEHACGMSSI